MEIFLVGGAVRDSLLGRPIHDKDWVVVGGTPEEMLYMGYEKVGADFPVFLHPVSKEEYALARQERKVGPGYHGFETHFEPDVSITDDLRRRDLTINAMAKDVSTGAIIDPFGGQEDLENGILRHVSDAFAEDPLRVLRVARFAARYNFNIHEDTMKLMTELVDAGELDHLTPERVWAEITRAVGEDHPDRFFLALEECGATKVLFPELKHAMFYIKLALDSAVDTNAPVLQRFMIIFATNTIDEVDTMCYRLKAPERIRIHANKFNRFFTEGGNDAEHMFNLMNELDFFRHPDQLYTILKVQLHFSSSVNIHLFMSAFREARKISFSTLSLRQQIELQGKAIGDAIDQKRLKKIKEVFASDNV